MLRLFTVLIARRCPLSTAPALTSVPVTDDQTTDRVLRQVVETGEAWLSGTTFGARRAIRLSACNWQTTEAYIGRALAAFRNAVTSDPA